MTVLDNLITVGVLLALFLLGYCKMTDRTLSDVFKEVRDLVQPEEEEIYL